jgi:hypothetical protein
VSSEKRGGKLRTNRKDNSDFERKKSRLHMEFMPHFLSVSSNPHFCLGHCSVCGESWFIALGIIKT